MNELIKFKYRKCVMLDGATDIFPGKHKINPDA